MAGGNGSRCYAEVRLRSATTPEAASSTASMMNAHSESVGTGVGGGTGGAGPGSGTVRHWVLTVLVSSVTAPFRARTRPVTLAPVVNVMLVSARTFPANDEPAPSATVPNVAELPTCQNTLHGEPPLITTTDAPLAVVSVLPI